MKMTLGRVMALAAVPVLLLAAGAGGALAQTASGPPPPPPGYEAQSASFVSAQTGFVLGARHCSILPCKALLEKTVNGGKSWAKVQAPAVELTPPFIRTPASAVSTVRFENASDGWLFNPALWATTDGGKQWHRVNLHGTVYMLAASDGEVFAAVEPANGGPDQGVLYKSAVGSSTWTLVRGVRPQEALTVFGHSAWTGGRLNIWTTANSGKTWSKLPFFCQPYLPDVTAVAAASPEDLAIACTDHGDPLPGNSEKEVFVSTDGGRKFVEATGTLPTAGEADTLAMPVGRPALITMTAWSGATYLYKTVNDGKKWTTQTFLDAGLGIRDLAYVSGTTGYMVHWNAGTPDIAYTLGLMKTVNAGATWTSVTIP